MSKSLSTCEWEFLFKFWKRQYTPLPEKWFRPIVDELEIEIYSYLLRR